MSRPAPERPRTPASTSPGPRPAVGVSACLLGERVRHDGGHKRDAWISGELARRVALVPFCPEVAAGLGVPRPPIRLEGDPDGPRAVGVDDPELDATAALEADAARVAVERPDLCGLVLKADSPSCGPGGVKVYPAGGGRPRSGAGVFARALAARLPGVPNEDEAALADPERRHDFLARVAARHRWLRLAAAGPDADALVRFHARHKLLLMALSPAACTRMGRLVAGAGGGTAKAADAYGALFLAALGRRAGRGRHVNVLQHLAGYLTRHLDAADRAELAEAITAYGRAEAPRAVPVTLLTHHFRRHPHPWVARQVYLAPDPLGDPGTADPPGP